MPFDATPINTVAETLRRAKALIDSPEKWEQYDCNAMRPAGARGHCMVSALNHTAPAKTHSRALTILRAAAGAEFLPIWNDAPERTHAEVMAAFDRAIELAEAES